MIHNEASQPELGQDRMDGWVDEWIGEWLAGQLGG